jgi:hypothetical protein
MQKPSIFLVAATLEKSKTYVFERPKIRDREVGGSNPLAPTNKLHDMNFYGRHLLTAVFVCGQLVDKNSLAKIRSCRTGLEVEEKAGRIRKNRLHLSTVQRR